MPRTLVLDPWLPHLLASQDQVLARLQAHRVGLNNDAIAHRVRYDGWQELMPNVFLTHAGEPARRQLLVAALLWAGQGSAIDGPDACHFHGLRSVAATEGLVHVAVPADSGRRSVGFVRVRRSAHPLTVIHSRTLRYVDPATAVIVATRAMKNDRAILAALSESVQRRLCTPDQLMRAHLLGPRRNARAADDPLADVLGGARSAPEGDFRRWAIASAVLPPLLYNCLLRLPDGRKISPDALALDAGLVHETNGGSAHKREDLFEDMQERHDVMTAAGLTVLHNPPRRLRLRGREAITEMERCYQRLQGRGLPPGVVLLRSHA